MNQEQERQIARSRIYVYDTIIGILNRLPDQDLIRTVKSGEMDAFLQGYGAIGNPLLTAGAEDIRIFAAELTPAPERIEQLAVDRTTILRAPQKGTLKPPYESLYCAKEKKEGLLGRLQKTYIGSGFIPVDARDTADFLLIELDFLKRLIQQGEKRRQQEFMTEHIGSWVPRYAQAAAAAAETAFYRGWMRFLEGFIQVEAEYLK